MTANKLFRLAGSGWAAVVLFVVICGFVLVVELLPAYAQTANGEIEGRPAPVARRKCEGGANAGNLCNKDADCPGSTCPDRNVFNITVAIQFNATAAEIDVIKDAISDLSAVLFDVTDGQAEIGQATIFNNAFATAADVRIYPTTTPVWWMADTGNWKVGGSIHVSYDNLSGAVDAGESLAHEFVHLVFDARDEYESRAVGCGAVVGNASCPHATTQGAGHDGCLMDVGGLNAGDPGTELCWGQGDPTDLTDVSGGDHDATNVTEQSRCRSNRSCWDQVVWSWPNTILAPAGAPDPAAGGAVVGDTSFVEVDDTVRVVLVLDESGSMSSESPTRMERLKVAANDFVTLAEDGSELGIVSFSNDAETASGRVNVVIAALGANRTAWTNGINGLSPDSRTNIGAGLQKAMDMIDTAGGVTANTFIVLMTDGINNEPSPQATADADLQAKLADLLADGIPVYVTCTGSDLGLQSQCSEIATGTGGFYVDSADANQLMEAFVDFHEMTQRREGIDSARGTLMEAKEKTVFVEPDAHSVTFTLVWHEPKADANMIITDPQGTRHSALPIPQGRYIRISNPATGDWRIIIDNTGQVDSTYIARAYVKNQMVQLQASVRHPTVLPGEEIYVYAHPRFGGPVSNPEKTIVGTVLLPDGSTETIELHDQGRVPGSGGDDLADDGIFTGVYRKTNLKGAYTFLLPFDVDGWRQSGDTRKRYEELEIPRFVREVRISAAVGHPDDVKTEEGQPEPAGWCKLAALLLALLILCLLLLWWRCERRRRMVSKAG